MTAAELLKNRLDIYTRLTAIKDDLLDQMAAAELLKDRLDTYTRLTAIEDDLLDQMDAEETVPDFDLTVTYTLWQSAHKAVKDALTSAAHAIRLLTKGQVPMDAAMDMVIEGTAQALLERFAA